MLQISAGPKARRRHLFLPLAIATLLLSAFVFAPSSGAASRPGYTFVTPGLLGEAPGGYKVYVSTMSPHRRSLAAVTASAVRRLRGLGLPVVWKGYRPPSPHATQGILFVVEGPKGCSGSASTLANTYWWYGGVPGGGYYMYRSDIVICPSRYASSPSWQRTAMVRHEMGHAMGLGHTSYVFNRSYQVMASYTHRGVTDYRSGDVAGLRKLAAGTARVRRAFAN